MAAESGEGDVDTETGTGEIALEFAAPDCWTNGNGFGRRCAFVREDAGEKEGDAGAELVLAMGVTACRGWYEELDRVKGAELVDKVAVEELEARC